MHNVKSIPKIKTVLLRFDTFLLLLFFDKDNFRIIFQKIFRRKTFYTLMSKEIRNDKLRTCIS